MGLDQKRAGAQPRNQFENPAYFETNFEGTDQAFEAGQTDYRAVREANSGKPYEVRHRGPVENTPYNQYFRGLRSSIMTEKDGQASKRITVPMSQIGKAPEQPWEASNRAPQNGKYDFVRERIRGFQQEAAGQKDFEAAIRAFEFNLRHAIETWDNGERQEIVDNGLNPERMKKAYNRSDLTGLDIQLDRLEQTIKKSLDSAQRNSEEHTNATLAQKDIERIRKDYIEATRNLLSQAT